MPNFGDFQIGLYLEGMFNGSTPPLTTNLARLEDHARDVLSAEAMGYIVPSAGDGATARAFLYGLALAGQEGVEHVLRCLLAELDLALSLSGYPDPAAIGPEALQRF